MIINNEFNFGQIVYLETDPEQRPRMVTAITMYYGGKIKYTLSCGTHDTEHYGLEINAEKNILITLTN